MATSFGWHSLARRVSLQICPTNVGAEMVAVEEAQDLPF